MQTLTNERVYFSLDNDDFIHHFLGVDGEKRKESKEIK